MKTETILAVEMVRIIRDRQSVLYWKDKAAYLERMKEAANKMKELPAQQRGSRSLQ